MLPAARICAALTTYFLALFRCAFEQKTPSRTLGDAAAERFAAADADAAAPAPAAAQDAPDAADAATVAGTAASNLWSQQAAHRCRSSCLAPALYSSAPPQF